MSPFVACLDTPSLFASVGAAAALIVVSALGAKAFLARIEHPKPPLWQTIALTAFEPIAYLGAPMGLFFLDHLGFGLAAAPPAILTVGLAAAFVCIAGLHGALLGRVDPNIGETRRFGLSLLYSVPVPGVALASVPLLMLF